MGVQPGSTAAGAEGVTRYQAISVWLLLTIISAISKGMSWYPFAAVGLHFQNSGWVLWHLGVTNLVAFITRTVTQSLIARFGPWFSAPILILRTLLLVPNALYPDSELATIAALVAYWVLEPELGLQGLCHDRFKGDPLELKRASRTQSLSMTTGYAVTPLFCGIAFDLGGWRLVSALGLVAQAISAFMLCINPLIHEDWRKRRQQSSEHAPDPERGGEAGQESKARKRGGLSSLPRALVLPGVMTALGMFSNLYSYHCEWVTFAVYFRDEHDWTNSSVAAFFQMIGDVIGAIVLVLSMRVKTNTPNGRPGMCSRAFSRPFDISWLLVAWAVLDLAIAVPNLYVAVVAQIVMGTVFVFFIQYVNEMNMTLAAGDPNTYLVLQLLCSIFHCTGCSISGTASLLLYESVGPHAPFYVCAGVSLLCALPHATYFMLKGMPSAADDVPAVATRRRSKSEEANEERVGRKSVASSAHSSHWSLEYMHVPSGCSEGMPDPVWVDSSAAFREAIAKVANAIFEQEMASPENAASVGKSKTYQPVAVTKQASVSKQRSLPRKSIPARLIRPWSIRVWQILQIDKPDDILTRERFGSIISEIDDLNMAEEDIDLIFKTMDREQSGEVPLDSFTTLIASLASRNPAFANRAEEEYDFDDGDSDEGLDSDEEEQEEVHCANDVPTSKIGKTWFPEADVDEPSVRLPCKGGPKAVRFVESSRSSSDASPSAPAAGKVGAVMYDV